MAKVSKPYKVRGTTLVSNTSEAVFCKYLDKHLQQSLSSQFSPRGEYSVSLVSDPDDEQWLVFKAKIDAIIDAAYDEAMNDEGDLKLGTSAKKKLNKAYPYKEYIEKEKDDKGKWTIEKETGKLVLTPKMKNVLDRDEGRNYIKLIGDNGEVPVAKRPEIGNGSLIKVKMYVNPYYMATTGSIGVSLSLDAIKIINLVSFGGGDAGEDFDTEDFEAGESEVSEDVDY